MIYNYINRITKGKVQIDYMIHEKKHHGIVPNLVDVGVKLLIVPDAGSSNCREIEELHRKGIDVLVLDHHLASKYCDYAITINNQMCDYPNKELSGGGVTYKFCQAVDDELGVNYADDYLDLLATSLIADMMNTQSLETRYYIKEGLREENIKNPFLRALIDRQKYSINGKLNMTSIAFYVAPLINGTIRMGTHEEKLDMFKAFLEDTEKTAPYKKRGTDFEIYQPLSEAMARICSNVRAKQARVRDKAVKIIEERIQEKETYKNKVIIVNATGILDTNLTGLVAMQLTQKYRRPVLILQIRDRERNIFGGSGRGYENGAVTDFRQFVLDTGVFDMAQGHPNAFGISIKAKNVERANEIMNEKLKDYEFESRYGVDFIVPSRHLDTSFVKAIAEQDDLWGRGVEQPKVAIEDIILGKDDVQLIGKNENTIKFTSNGVEFVKFRSGRDEYEEILKGDNIIEVNVIGRCDTNEFRGRKTQQIIIEDIDSRASDEFIF